MDNNSENQENNFIEFKIITLGEPAVGKTSIIKRFVSDDFDPNQISTMGVSLSFKVMKINKTNLKLSLIDTGGQEKYRSLSKSYFKHVDVILFVFDLNNKHSFDCIQYWVDLLNENVSESDIKGKYLIGNKNDLEQMVDQKLIDEISKKNNLKYMSTSAMTKHQIDILFKYIGETLYEHIKKEKEKNPYSNGRQKTKVIIKKNTKPPKKKCC